MANSTPTTYSLNITADDGEQTVSSDATKTALQLRSFFHRAASGGNRGDVTMKCRTSTVTATGTVTAAAVEAADTVSINGTALTATTHTARGTATCVSVAEDDALSVAGVTFTVKDTPDPEEPLEVETGSTDTEMAENFAAAINANETTSAVVKATNVAGVVHIKALAVGTGGNAIALTETGTTITASGAGTLAGGAAVANNQFDFHAAWDDDTATALAAAINASTTALISKHVTAEASSAAVTVTAKIPGHAGNAVTIASSDGTRLAITASATRLTGGTETLTTHTF